MVNAASSRQPMNRLSLNVMYPLSVDSFCGQGGLWKSETDFCMGNNGLGAILAGLVRLSPVSIDACMVSSVSRRLQFRALWLSPNDS